MLKTYACNPLFSQFCYYRWRNVKNQYCMFVATPKNKALFTLNSNNNKKCSVVKLYPDFYFPLVLPEVSNIQLLYLTVCNITFVEATRTSARMTSTFTNSLKKKKFLSCQIVTLPCPRQESSTATINNLV